MNHACAVGAGGHVAGDGHAGVVDVQRGGGAGAGTQNDGGSRNIAGRTQCEGVVDGDTGQGVGGTDVAEEGRVTILHKGADAAGDTVERTGDASRGGQGGAATNRDGGGFSSISIRTNEAGCRQRGAGVDDDGTGTDCIGRGHGSAAGERQSTDTAGSDGADSVDDGDLIRQGQSTAGAVGRTPDDTADGGGGGGSTGVAQSRLGGRAGTSDVDGTGIDVTAAHGQGLAGIDGDVAKHGARGTDVADQSVITGNDDFTECRCTGVDDATGQGGGRRVGGGTQGDDDVGNVGGAVFDFTGNDRSTLDGQESAGSSAGHGDGAGVQGVGVIQRKPDGTACAGC